MCSTALSSPQKTDKIRLIDPHLKNYKRATHSAGGFYHRFSEYKSVTLSSSLKFNCLCSLIRCLAFLLHASLSWLVICISDFAFPLHPYPLQPLSRWQTPLRKVVLNDYLSSDLSTTDHKKLAPPWPFSGVFIFFLQLLVCFKNISPSFIINTEP